MFHQRAIGALLVIAISLSTPQYGFAAEARVLRSLSPEELAGQPYISSAERGVIHSQIALSHWSRLKRRSNFPGAPAYDLTSLPPIEAIVADSDIRPFLQVGVPEELTQAALRTAWVVDPAIREFIGIAENQWNFNDNASIPGFGPLDGISVRKRTTVFASARRRVERPIKNANIAEARAANAGAQMANAGHEKQGCFTHVARRALSARRNEDDGCQIVEAAVMRRVLSTRSGARQTFVGAVYP